MSAVPRLLSSFQQRESATVAMLRQIDDKLARLATARRERAAALQRIRCEIARAIGAEPAAPERRELRS